MNDEKHDPRIRRIVVALDSSAQDGGMLRAVAALAARLQAELHGLFILDANLTRFAELPCATEVISSSAAARNIDPAVLRKDLQRQIDKVSRALASIAQQQNVRWSFETAGGHVESEVLARLEQADLLIVNRRTGRTLVSRDQLGSTATFVISKSRRTVVVLEEHARLDRPPIVLFEDPQTGLSALATAVRLLQDDGLKLTVLIAAASKESFEALKAEADTWLQKHRCQSDYKWLRRPAMQTLAHVIWEQGGGVLVLAADTPILEKIALGALMQELKLPVVLVR